MLRWDVTPFVGVWIETDTSYYNGVATWSHPSWVCGLKLTESLRSRLKVSGHTLRGCVD